MIPVMPPALSRRSLLRAVALAGGALALAGCDAVSTDRVVSPTDRVEPDDPATWPADTALLISARQRVHSYRLGLDAVGRDTSSVTEQLDELWRAQQERLELLITLGGVPLPHLHDEPAVTVAGSGDAAGATGEAAGSTGDGGGSTSDAGDSTGDGGTATSPADRPDAEALGQALMDDHTDACRELSTATPTNLAQLASLAAQHAAAAVRLGAPVEWGPLEGPAGAAAVPVLAVTRPAVFGLEVLAARSAPGGDERAGYESVLRSLRGVTRQLSTLAGEAAPVAPLGYDLPEPLESAEERRELARRLVADIAPATLEASLRIPGDLAQLAGIVRIVAGATVWTAQLGGSAGPFPGMTLP